VPVFADDQAGPVRGLEGLVVQRQGMMQVMPRLDPIGQVAAVKVMADEIEAAWSREGHAGCFQHSRGTGPPPDFGLP